MQIPADSPAETWDSPVLLTQRRLIPTTAIPIMEHSHLQREQRAGVLSLEQNLGWAEPKSSISHSPAHPVSQNPKEVGANEVGDAGRQERHPWETERIQKCLVPKKIQICTHFHSPAASFGEYHEPGQAREHLLSQFLPLPPSHLSPP